MMNHRITRIFRKGPKTSRKTTAAYKELLRNRLPYEFVQEGICRADTFILQMAGWKFYQDEFMPCVEASWRTYEKERQR